MERTVFMESPYRYGTAVAQSLPQPFRIWEEEAKGPRPEPECWCTEMDSLIHDLSPAEATHKIEHLRQEENRAGMRKKLFSIHQDVVRRAADGQVDSPTLNPYAIEGRWIMEDLFNYYLYRLLLRAWNRV